VSDLKAALRYSRALFAAAQRRDRVGRVRLELSCLARALQRLPELHTLWHARLPAGRKKAAVEAIFKDRLSPLVLQFLSVLVMHRREKYLAYIARSFATLSRRAEKRQELEVVTALPLPGDLQPVILKTVTGMTGAELEVQFSMDPGILGGVLLKIGDRVIDASINGRLKRLRAELQRGF